MELNLAHEDTAARRWDNATLIARTNLTEESAIFRIQPDGALFEFQAGQYTAIGLPAGAPRVEGADPDEDANGDPGRRIVRAYSIASSSNDRESLDLYITLVGSGALTPRLWVLQPGDRVWLGPKAKGHFTMEGVPSDSNVVLIGTGTGLAPYISMIHDHHQCNIGRRFVVIHGARYERELGYRDELEALDRDCGTMVYLPTVSRPEPDSHWSGHVGRVQSVVADGTLEAALGAPVSPDKTQVFVSGNPEMVMDMERVFAEQGFALHSARSPGTLHIERYW